VPGYPIRTSSDHSSVDSSPRPIAASHVLHRLLMPRHPPCALDNLTNTHIKKSRHNKTLQKQKMLASTVQFSTTTRTTNPPAGTPTNRSNDRTRETHPNPRTTPPRARSEGGRGPGRPLRTQQCAPRPPHTWAGQGKFGVSTFSRATPTRRPPPTPPQGRTAGARLSGPSTTPHPVHGTVARGHRHPVVFGEAP
jgi:hypothetical protein